MVQPERSGKASLGNEKSSERRVKLNEVCVLVGLVPGRRKSTCEDSRWERELEMCRREVVVGQIPS